MENKVWLGGSPESELRYSDEKQHTVIISKAFWLGKYEITRGQWSEVTGEKPWSVEDYMDDYMPDNRDHAATYISWESIHDKFLGGRLVFEVMD